MVANNGRDWRCRRTDDTEAMPVDSSCDCEGKPDQAGVEFKETLGNAGFSQSEKRGKMMEVGYYWFKSYVTQHKWSVCEVRKDSTGFLWVDFFGMCSQEAGNEWLTKCVTFGDKIEPSESEAR